MCRLETFTDRILVWRRQVRREMAAGLQWNQPREKWDAWDPMLLSEGLFSAANIFSSLKLVYIFSVNPHLGPLQVSLSRMVLDILKFFVLDILVIFAFSCGKYNTNIYIFHISCISPLLYMRAFMPVMMTGNIFEFITFSQSLAHYIFCVCFYFFGGELKGKKTR